MHPTLPLVLSLTLAVDEPPKSPLPPGSDQGATVIVEGTGLQVLPPPEHGRFGHSVLNQRIQQGLTTLQFLGSEIRTLKTLQAAQRTQLQMNPAARTAYDPAELAYAQQVMTQMKTPGMDRLEGQVFQSFEKALKGLFSDHKVARQESARRALTAQGSWDVESFEHERPMVFNSETLELVHRLDDQLQPDGTPLTAAEVQRFGTKRFLDQLDAQKSFEAGEGVFQTGRFCQSLWPLWTNYSTVLEQNLVAASTLLEAEVRTSPSPRVEYLTRALRIQVLARLRRIIGLNTNAWVMVAAMGPKEVDPFHGHDGSYGTGEKLIEDLFSAKQQP